MFKTCPKLQCISKINRNQAILLMIENFETNQMVLYLPVGYTMHLETTCTFLWYPYTIGVPLCPQSYRKKIVYHQYCYLLNVTFQPLPNRKSQGPKLLSNYSPYPICHVSLVTYHMSRVTCNVSYFSINIFFFKQFWSKSVCMLSTEPSLYSFKTFSY